MPKKILIVDDDPDILALIKTRLKFNGYTVFTALNGYSGLEMVRQHAPDLIITDILMPEMDGFAFYKELKKSANTSQIPVLVLTARHKTEDSFRAMGAEDFVTKPFNPQQFLAKIEELLNKSSAVKKILVASSSKSASAQILAFLLNEGHKALRIPTGVKLVAGIQEFNPDIILIEISLDDWRANEVIKDIRQLPGVQDKPVLVYSEPVEKELIIAVDASRVPIESAKVACLLAGATEYVGSTDDFFVLMSGITKYLISPKTD